MARELRSLLEFWGLKEEEMNREGILSASVTEGELLRLFPIPGLQRQQTQQS